MSNSIWKTPDQKPDEADTRKQILFCAGGSTFPYLGWHYPNKGFGTWDYKDVQKWAYLEDVLAQADKAERLQKQLDSLKKYSDSLRNRINKMLKKNKTLKNTAADYFMKSIELGIELEKKKSNN